MSSDLPDLEMEGAGEEEEEIMSHWDEITDPGVEVSSRHLYLEIRSLGEETKKDFDKVNHRLNEQGERIVSIETSQKHMTGEIKKACSAANGASQKIANISGQWKTIAALAGSLVLGYLSKWLIG